MAFNLLLLTLAETLGWLFSGENEMPFLSSTVWGGFLGSAAECL